MDSVTQTITVHAPVQACYDWWRPLTRLPEIFTDVHEVTARDHEADHTDWTVAGPGGVSLHWQAKLTEDAPPHQLSWITRDVGMVGVGALRHAGTVRFIDQGNGYTQVEVSLRYEPPAGKLGETVARLLDDPQRKLEQACTEFQTIIEQR